MINLLSLLKDTPAYKSVKGDKSNGRLSHAYLLLCRDKLFLKDYLKLFAKSIMCEESDPCGECRTCKLIDKEAHSDVLFYPKKETISTEDVGNIIEESFLKPVESVKKLFVIVGAEDMSPIAQNKLLKTLEEPPKGVCILLGATNEFNLLSTLKSRVKKITVPLFEGQTVFDLLKEDYPDLVKLKRAVSCGDGTLGKVVSLYGDEKLALTTDLIKDVLVNMQSSKKVLEYSVKITESGVDVGEFISATELVVRDMLAYYSGKENLVFNKSYIEEIAEAKGFSQGAAVFILDRIIEANKRKKFNGNLQMITEWLLFSVLEGKHKWQKS